MKENEISEEPYFTDYEMELIKHRLKGNCGIAMMKQRGKGNKVHPRIMYRATPLLNPPCHQSEDQQRD